MGVNKTTLPLRELCSAIIDCPHFTPLWTEQGVVVLRNENIRLGKLDLSTRSYTNEENFIARTQRALPTARDLVITREAPMGEVCMIPDGLKCCLGQRMVLLRPNESKVVPSYLLYALQSEVVQDQIRVQGGTGSTVSNLRIPVLSALQIPVPPTSGEQRNIASALTDADALIDLLEQLLTKKRQIKQGAMQELLTGRRRLPGFSGDWPTAKVADLERVGVLELSRGKVISKKSIASDPGQYPIYSSSVHNNGLFGCYGSFMFDEELITWSVDGGGDFFYRPRHKFSVTNVCGYMRVRRDVHCQFLAMQLQQQHSNKSFDYQIKAHPSVVRAEYLVYLPELKEQVAVAEVLSDMDEELIILESRLTKARALKQAMAQALLTGRIRLVEPVALPNPPRALAA